MANNSTKHTEDFDQIEAFLKNNAFDVADNGFSERVLSRLPERAGWERRLQRIWQMVCLAAAIVVGWLTNILDVVATDVRVFIHTLPLDYSYTQIFTFVAISMLLVYALAIRVVYKEV